jgi:hypothetical protein
MKWSSVGRYGGTYVKNLVKHNNTINSANHIHPPLSLSLSQQILIRVNCSIPSSTLSLHQFNKVNPITQTKQIILESSFSSSSHDSIHVSQTLLRLMRITASYMETLPSPSPNNNTTTTTFRWVPLPLSLSQSQQASLSLRPNHHFFFSRPFQINNRRR